jgi:hypothetical protein
MCAGPVVDQPVHPRIPAGVGAPLRAIGRPDRRPPLWEVTDPWLRGESVKEIEWACCNG